METIPQRRSEQFLRCLTFFAHPEVGTKRLIDVFSLGYTKKTLTKRRWGIKLKTKVIIRFCLYSECGNKSYQQIDSKVKAADVTQSVRCVPREKISRQL